MRRTCLRPVSFSLILCLVAGCAAGGRSVDTGTTGTTGARIDPKLITREQIQEPRFSTAYDAVKALRGSWLSARATAAESFRYPSEVQVYLDGVHLGGVDALQTIACPPIQYIRFFSGLEASQRWGVDHGRGVIWISNDAKRPGASGPPPDTED